jgi:putative endonuclease
VRAGRWGERHALRHYRDRRGAQVLATNWRGGGGELDLVVREGDTLVLVEVKTRDSNDPDPLAAVRDPRRLRHFQAAAAAYLERLPRPRPPVRHDVLLVTGSPDDGEPRIDCLVDVLGAPG